MNDLKDKRIGRLTALYISGKQSGCWVWHCKCDCGNEVDVNSHSLVREGGTRSCGCIRKEKSRQKATKHGLSHNRIYHTWISMRDRCNNPNKKEYHRYGGRGIRVCEKWDDFKNFYDDMFPSYQEGLELDRIDYNGNYEPGNCRWLTRTEQMNNVSTNIIVKFRGEEYTLKNLCRKYGLNYDTVHNRFRKGLDIETAVSAIFKNGTNQIIGYKNI